MERTTDNVCLKTSPASYIKQTLNRKSYCMVCLAIPILVMVTTWIMLLFSRSIIRTCDMKDVACLHVVQILRRPISPPAIRYKPQINVDRSKKYVTPLAAAIYGKWTQQSAWQYHQANADNSGFKADKVWALETLCGLQSQKKLTK
jgi:hypothetical protein